MAFIGVSLGIYGISAIRLALGMRVLPNEFVNRPLCQGETLCTNKTYIQM